MEIINTAILKEYSKQFNYDEVIKVQKDSMGNITMLQADTLKMNKIAADVALESQKELRNLGDVGISIPFGYIFKNNILAPLGPNITIKMQPIGYIETKYFSEFESAGINQTRHRIYVQVIANLRIVVPLKDNEIKVKCETPIAETIIVGKTPNSAINLDLQGAGYKVNNGQ